MNEIFRQIKKENKLWISKRVDFPAHIHKDIEIVFALKGSFTAFCCGKKYTVRKGMFFISFPDQIHYYQNGDENGEYAILVFKASEVLKNRAIIENSVPKIPIACLGEDFDKIKMLLESYAINFGEEKNDIRELVVSLVFNTVSEKLSFCDKNSVSDNTEKIIEYCEKHFTENISLSKLADDLFISRSYASYIFGKKLLINFCEYINSLRIEYAVELIENGDMKITEIADKCGFNTIRSFNRAFLKNKGITPSDYRKNIR